MFTPHHISSRIEALSLYQSLVFNTGRVTQFSETNL